MGYSTPIYFMNTEKVYLSKEKFEELKQELQDLKTKSRKDIAEKLEYAKSLGDLSENSEYQEAREAQSSNEERIAEIEDILKSAEIVSGRKGDTVSISSTVVVERVKDRVRQTYRLVGSEEANIAEKKISIKSPLGEAMLGKRSGDVFVSHTPNGDVEYTVVTIS